MRSSASFVLLVLGFTSISTRAQNTYGVHGCEAPAVRAAFDTTLSQDELAKLTTPERAARRQQVLDALIKKYPHEYLLRREQLSIAMDPFREDRDAANEIVRQKLVSDAKADPDDPMALLLAGVAMKDTDPSEAIRLLEAAKTKAPRFPWPSFELEELYERGSHADDAKLKENLEHFYTLCPTWVASGYGNQFEGFKLRKDLPLVAKLAVAMRVELARQRDLNRLKDYAILWQREFQTRPPSEHDAERAQVRKDLARLEKLNPHGDAQWRLFLISGYKLAGSSNDELAQMQREAAKDFPHLAPAEQLEQSEWEKDHPQPDGQKDAVAWKAYDAASVDHVKRLMSEFPEDTFLQRTQFFFTVQDDEYVSQADGIAAVDLYLKSMDTYGAYGVLSAEPTALPRFLLKHGWEPERALELLKNTSTYKDGGHSKEHWSASLDAKTVERFHRNIVSDDYETLGLILKAASLADKPEEAMKFRAVIEEPPHENKKDLEHYWTNRARFATIDRRPEDALAYYRMALDDRLEPPTYSQGVLQDELSAELHTLWTKQGGTETAWAAWNPPAVAETAEVAQAGATAGGPTVETKKNPKAVATQEGAWQKVTKTMPAFQLSDFSGKQWKQADLAGKVVVVVSWATWCGPCHSQDALLQKFYDKVKDRGDLVIVSFNIDENPGQVLPFMRKQGYAFPVLAAFSYPDVQDFVPRTWIIDKRGIWSWVKNGYDESKTYADFETDMLRQIGKVETGQ